MALVHKQQKVLGEVVEQRYRRGTRRSARKNARVVLNALAGAYFAQHFHVVACALFDALRFYQLVVLGEVLHALFHFLGYLVEGVVQARLSHDVVRSREYHDMQQRCADVAGERVEFADAVYFVAEEFHAYRHFVGSTRGEYLQRVALCAELVSCERHLVALVLYLHKAPDDILAAYLLPLTQRQRVAAVILRAAQRVDA
ncbi:unknown [Eubacterium sp. CAG:786]|nr:unknown [Eubacterium sp. CAG:786]